MTEVKDAKQAIAIGREYIKEMLGHPYFELESLETVREPYRWILKLRVVHLLRKADGPTYKIIITSTTGEIENVERIEQSN